MREHQDSKDRLLSMSQPDRLVGGDGLAAGVALLRIEAEAKKPCETTKICHTVRKSSLPIWLAASKVRGVHAWVRVFCQMSSDLASWLTNGETVVGVVRKIAECFLGRESIRRPLL